jgi:hypothetical protein
VFLPYTTAALLVAIIFTSVRVQSRGDQHNGLMIGLAAWIFALLLTALPVLSYLVPYSPSADQFIAVCLTVATAGYHLMRKLPITPPMPSGKLLENGLTARTIGLIGILGNCLLLLYAAKSGTSLNPSSVLQNLSSIRNKDFELAVTGVHGVVGVFGTSMAPASYLYLVIIRPKASRLLYITSFVLIVFVALTFYGGRQTIFVAVLLVVIARWLRGAKFSVSPRTVILSMIALVCVWYFTTSFVAHRQTVSNPPLVLRITSHAKYGPWTVNRAYANHAFAGQLQQYSYLSSPIPALMYYLDSGLVPKPLYGAYSFPLPAEVVGLLSGSYSKTQWIDARMKVFRPFTANGYLGNAWATLLRDLVADFGKIGAVIFCFCLGGFMAWARNRYEDTGDAFYRALETYATLTFTFGAFQSLLYGDYVANGFFLALIVVMARRLMSRTGSRSPRPRPTARGNGSGRADCRIDRSLVNGGQWRVGMAKDKEIL